MNPKTMAGAAIRPFRIGMNGKGKFRSSDANGAQQDPREVPAGVSVASHPTGVGVNNTGLLIPPSSLSSPLLFANRQGTISVWRSASNGQLNFPSTIVQTSANFGALSNSIIIGTFGDGITGSATIAFKATPSPLVTPNPIPAILLQAMLFTGFGFRGRHRAAFPFAALAIVLLALTLAGVTGCSSDAHQMSPQKTTRSLRITTSVGPVFHPILLTINLR
jgi:hypothetical protein